MTFFSVLSNYAKFFCIGFFALFFSCSSDKSAVSEQDVPSVDSTTLSPSIDMTQPHKIYALVDNLRVRAANSFRSEAIAMLKEGEELTYLGIQSVNVVEVELRGQKIKSPFYKVKTVTNLEGWVFGGAVGFEKSAIKGYRAVLAFVSDNTKDIELEAVDDWSHYSSEALELARKAGLITHFTDKDFDKVTIKNGNGEVMDVVNIQSYVKKYKWGILCLEKGKEPYLVEFDTDMAKKVGDYFQIKSK